MHKVGFFIAGILGTTIVAFAGCGGNGGGSGAATTGTTHPSSSHAGSGGSTSASGTNSSNGTTTSSGSSSSSGKTPAICNVPATPPSHGSCVPFTGGDAGEADAGFDDAGNASATICNPVTNAGCTGTDVCDTDNSGKHWVCYLAGTNIVATCGDCGASNAVCKGGNTCINFTTADGGVIATSCSKYCCTDADCGGTANTCSKGLSPPPPNNVGICAQ
jgi:hypothetical protein